MIPTHHDTISMYMYTYLLDMYIFTCINTFWTASLDSSEGSVLKTAHALANLPLFYVQQNSKEDCPA